MTMPEVLTKILIVEDDADLSRAMATRLRAAGFEVAAARDAYFAVQVARQERPALIIMDVRMPAGDGFRVHEILNKFSDFVTPVIYLTGCQSDEDKARARKLGAVAYLPKPVDMGQLLKIIHSHLSASSAALQENQHAG